MGWAAQRSWSRYMGWAHRIVGPWWPRVYPASTFKVKNQQIQQKTKVRDGLDKKEFKKKKVISNGRSTKIPSSDSKKNPQKSPEISILIGDLAYEFSSEMENHNWAP